MTRESLLLAVDLLPHGGIQRVARSLATGLAEQGNTQVWSLNDPVAANGLPSNVRVRAFKGSTAHFTAAAAAAATVRRSIVVSTHLHLAPLGIPHAWRGTPHVIYVHGVEVWRTPSRVQRAAVAQANRIVANSRFTLRRMEEFYGPFNPDRVVVLPPGIADRPPSRAQGDPRVVLVVGRMTSEDRYKGHDELLDLWPAIRREVPDVRLVFVGDGDDRARLETKARRTGIGDGVEFTGAIDEKAVFDRYDEAGIVALPSRFEGFGLVLIEAMRAGRPVIGAPGAAEEIIEPSVTGLIADPADSRALQAALLSLLTDARAAQRMGIAGRRRFEERFTEAQFYSGWRRVREQVA